MTHPEIRVQIQAAMRAAFPAAEARVAQFYAMQQYQLGWRDEQLVDWAPGSASDPMTRDQLLGKWRDCARHGAMARDDAPAVRLLDASAHTAAEPLLAPLRESLLAGIRSASRGGHKIAA